MMLEELLPPPVLSVGLTGHRNVGMTGATAEATERDIGAVLEALQRALPPVIAQDALFFSAATPVMRLVTMGAEGADLLGMRAAARHGLKVACVIPFALDDYRNDFSPAGADVAAELFAKTESLLELPGRRDEGPRAYERANDVILSNIDLLVAVWNGSRAHGRAGTGDVVQEAVIKGIPIIVVDPRSPAAPGILAAAPIDDVEPPVASDLARRPLPADLTAFILGIVSPPSRHAQRRALVDLVAETPQSAQWRFEYQLLLKTSARRPKAARKPAVAAAKPARPAAAAASVAPANANRLAAIDRARGIIDGLAVQYGRKFRSSAVSQYLVVILGTWISGVVGLLIPSLSAAAIAIQLLANGLVLADAAFRARHRWQERWLDYRVVAERLRWLGFRNAFGLGGGRQMRSGLQRQESWIDWYIRRTAHAIGPPQGKIDAASIAAAADHLSAIEIPDQIDYHRDTFRQLGLLERRLLFGAHAALVASLGVAVLLAISAVRTGSLDAVGWKPFAIVLLAILPATMTSLNGLRVDADLARLVERSAQTIARLFRVKRNILAAPRDYDHVAGNMQRLASLMSGELEEWRFVIESRRSRSRRRLIKKKKNFLRPYSDLQKRPVAGDSGRGSPPAV
jgi:hypothetical protein